MALTLSTVDRSGFPDWMRAIRTAFLQSPELSAEELELQWSRHDPDRFRGVFDDGRCVATLCSFPQQVTAVGGTPVPACAVTGVGVVPTHRRRGLLSRMLAAELTAAKEREEPLASLISAEHPIYGRFGFGPATWTTEWRVDLTRTGLDPRWSGPDDGGRIELIDSAAARRIGPELHERFRAGMPGAVSRDAYRWQRSTGEVRLPSEPWTEPFWAVYRDASDQVQGLVRYTSDDNWQAKVPHNTLTVLELLATTPAAERALWHFLCSIDWAAGLATGLRAPDDLLPLLLGDPRAARPTQLADMLWLRPLDVPRLLRTRRYPATGSLVLQVHDAAGLADGRFLLDATPEGADCTVTTRSPDLALGVGELAALYLGDESALRLVSLGRITEESAGAAAVADSLLRTSRRPWCPDVF